MEAVLEVHHFVSRRVAVEAQVVVAVHRVFPVSLVAVVEEPAVVVVHPVCPIQVVVEEAAEEVRMARRLRVVILSSTL